MTIHPSITLSRVIQACERRDTSLDNPGFCTYCGASSEGHEPDAEGDECERCGHPGVYGAEAIAILLF